MILRVEVKNAILGDSVFWEGPSERLEDIRNIPARDLARLVAKDGQTRKNGMWVVSALSEPSISLLADHVLVADILPDGVGVLPGEAGEPGPWYGVRMRDGSDCGWYRVKAHAEHVAETVWGARAVRVLFVHDNRPPFFSEEEKGEPGI